MGQIEKFFVFTIFLLVAVVLGITAFGGDAEATTGTPEIIHASIIPGNGGDKPAPETQSASNDGDQTDNGGGIIFDLAPEPTPTPATADPEPPKDDVIEEPTDNWPTTLKGPYPYYVVQSDDTLGQIMWRFLGSSFRYQKEVIDLNEGLNPNRMRKDQKIWLPKDRLLKPDSRAKGAVKIQIDPPEELSLPVKMRQHKIAKNDNLWNIAEKYFGKKDVLKNIEKIKKANPGMRPDALRIDDNLNIPE